MSQTIKKVELLNFNSSLENIESRNNEENTLRLKHSLKIEDYKKKY